MEEWTVGDESRGPPYFRIGEGEWCWNKRGALENATEEGPTAGSRSTLPMSVSTGGDGVENAQQRARKLFFGENEDGA